MNELSLKIIETVGRNSILDWVAQGFTVTSIADTVGVHIRQLSEWLNAEEQKEDYAKAKRASAQVFQDEALSIADQQGAEGYKATSASVQAAKLRTDVRMRMASQRDRTLAERYTPPEERPVQQVPQGITFIIQGVPSMAARQIQQGVTVDG